MASSVTSSLTLMRWIPSKRQEPDCIDKKFELRSQHSRSKSDGSSSFASGSVESNSRSTRSQASSACHANVSDGSSSRRSPSSRATWMASSKGLRTSLWTRPELDLAAPLSSIGGSRHSDREAQHRASYTGRRADGVTRDRGPRTATRRALGTGLARPCAGHPSFRRRSGGLSFRTSQARRRH